MMPHVISARFAGRERWRYGEPGDLIATYAYDGRNYRISRTVPDGEGTATFQDYYNENWQLVEVRKGTETTAHESYVWDPRYVDAPVLRDHDADDNPDTGGYGSRYGEGYPNTSGMEVSYFLKSLAEECEE